VTRANRSLPAACPVSGVTAGAIAAATDAASPRRALGAATAAGSPSAGHYGRHPSAESVLCSAGRVLGLWAPCARSVARASSCR